MKTRNLFNKLKLSFSPISNYDYLYLKNEIELEKYLNESNIYIIAQRPVLTFENLYFDPDLPVLKFLIKQKGNSEILDCSLLLKQECFSNLSCSKIGLRYSTDYEFGKVKQDRPPFNHLRDFCICCEDTGLGVWFTPEQFLYGYWNNYITAGIKGNINKFLKYQVHYIGKATENNVVKRLTGHEHLQDILSSEFPFIDGSLPTDEIVLLFFEFMENKYINFYGDDIEDIDEMFMAAKTGKMPEISTRAIYLDAEKALINALKPKHNKIFYKQYPKSKDGLEKHSLNINTYSFNDPISLMYNQGAICGTYESVYDILVIEKGESLRVVTGQTTHENIS